jgi:hypothetical protein
MRLRRIALVPGLGLGLLLAPIGSDPQAPAPTSGLEGSTATLLPDGRWLLVGGSGPDGPSATVTLWDAATQRTTLVARGLRHPRAGHTATVLPDGRVLVFGGTGRQGEVVEDAEAFDPDSRTLETLPALGLTPRTGHSATVLTDGRILLAGGRAGDGGLVAQGELWDPRTGQRESTPPLDTPRAGHTASLQPDGTVLLWGGVDQDGTELLTGEVYDPGADTITAIATAPPAAPAAPPAVVGSHPGDGDDAVPNDALIGIRVSPPLRVETVTATTVFLVGPAGFEGARVVAAEAGRLVFVTPDAPLQPRTRYTVTLNGPTDPTGTALPFTTLAFTTAGSAAAAGVPSAAPGSTSETTAGAPGGPIASATGVPSAEAGDAGASPTAAASEATLPPLAAAPGVTALAGRVLTLDGQPLAGVTLRIDAATARTDATGRFLLAVDTAGWHELLIDGRSASRPGRTYGIFEVGVELAAGQTTALPYTIWMPALDTAHAETIPSPTPTEVVVTTPAIPGLELRLPAGTVIRDHEGRVVTALSLTPIPVTRPPFPLAAGVAVPLYFTIQPGAAYVEGSAGARLIYPNRTGATPGARFDFWHYELGPRGWFIYGQGTVTADGRQIEPDPGVTIYEFTGAMVAPPGLAPPEGPPPANDAGDDGDPVDLATGLFVLRKSDLTLPDVVPLVFTRTYRPGDTMSRAFGVGATHSYDMFLVGTTWPYTYVDLILPDGVGCISIASRPGRGTRTPSTRRRPRRRRSTRRRWCGTGRATR